MGAVATGTIAAGELFGIGPGLDIVPMLATLEVTALEHLMLGAATVTGAVGWHRGTKRLKAVAARGDERCDDFLVAGVAVELALGDLRASLHDAKRGRPGSAETLAADTAGAQQALQHYIAALRTLDEKDVSIRFPWWDQDVDAAEARELLAVTADAVLARAGFAAGAEAEGGLLGQQPKAITARSSAGGLAPIIRSATALQEDLAAADRTLKAVESTIHQAARAATNGTAGQELQALADVVTETYLRGSFLEADCVSIKSAASSAGKADTRQEAFGHLKAAPSTATVSESFGKYASAVHQAESKLGKRPDQSLGTAVVAVRKALRDLPRLRITVNDLVTAMDAELERVGQPDA